MRNRLSRVLLAVLLVSLVPAEGQGLARVTRADAQPPAAPRAVDVKAPDGALLKASFFAAAKPGPCVLLLHQGNRDRHAWDGLAPLLAAAGVNTLTLDMRGFNGGRRYSALTVAERAQLNARKADDIDAALQLLLSQPGVNGAVIGIGGAGYFGVNNAVQTARRHSAAVKSLLLLSGQTDLAGRNFVHHASGLPILFVAADADEYPPTEEVMEWLYGLSPNPGKKFVHYTGAKARWLGTEDRDPVATTGNHGTDLLKTHPELPGTIATWFATTLLTTPGRAPANKNPAAGFLSVPVIAQMEMAGGTGLVARQLAEARRIDPKAQLWPFVVVNVMGYDNLQAGNINRGVEILKLNAAAYPSLADANDSLSDAYLAEGEKDLARQYAERALALIPSNTIASTGLAYESAARLKLIRDNATKKLKQRGALH